MLKKCNISEKGIFLKNLELSITYHKLEFFNFLMDSELKRTIIRDNEDFIIGCIFSSFSLEKECGAMLSAIMKYSKYNKYNKKIYEIPDSYGREEGECIG